MSFDPAVIGDHTPPARGGLLRRWLKRLGFFAVLTVGFGAALLLFAPLL